MIKRIQFGILFLLAGMFTANAQSQEVKIGYVFPQQIFQRMPEMAAVQQKIANFRDRKAAELRNKQAEFLNAQNVLQQKASVISEAALQAEQDSLAKMYQELQRASEEADNAVNNRRIELLGPLYLQLRQAINAVAEKQGLTYVLNATTSSGDQVILYVSNEYATKYNITDAVMRELGI